MIEPPTRLLRDSLKWKKLPNRRNNAMAEGINRYFMADTRAFVDANYLTTAGIFHPPEGTMAFDLHRQEGITPSVVTIEPTNTAKNDESIRGYWVPQGGSCDVPIIAADRAYVFTPDFSGCSLIVDQISDSMYRVYHVTGGNGYVEMEYRKRRDPASKLAGVMTHEFYGAPGAPRALMFMKFEEGRWWIYFQAQTGTGYGLQGNRVVRAQGSTAVDTIRMTGRMPVARVKTESPVITSNRLCDGQLIIRDTEEAPTSRLLRARKVNLMTELWTF